MGILRSDLLTHSQLQPTGSVFFDGTDDKITTTGFGNIGTSDFTLECWVYLSTTSGTQRIISANEGSQSTEYTQIRAHSTHGWQAYIGTDSGWWESKSGNDHSTFTTGWHHIVLQRLGNDGYIFVDGEYVITSQDGSSATNAADPVTVTTFVLGHGYGSEYLNAGYISNARISMKAVYGGTNFTPPKLELKPLGETYLLCCQSSSSSSEAAVAPSAGLTVTGAAASSFTPDLKKDITDTGVVFDGFGSFATSTYMIPPKGKTTERNRGRGISFGGDNNTTSILFVDIQSQGNAQDFGDLTAATVASPGACASSTRGLYGGGTPSNTNVIGFITIATTSNASDFGDLTQARRQLGGCSNDTRGLFGSGRVSDPVNTIDFVTIATTGDASDFGDVTTAARYLGSTSSTTRGFWFGGNAPTATNVINFVTIATTGDASDFGDLTEAKPYPTGCSSSTRAISLGGMVSAPNYINTIEYFTMASTGNGVDFGDCTEPNGNSSGMSNKTRGVRFAGGVVSGSYTNSIDFINIATTGNASDFGDFITAGGDGAGTSDSHGGLA